MVGVVEGVLTCKKRGANGRRAAAWMNGEGWGEIAMPISEGLYAVLFEGRDPRGQLAVLMSRGSEKVSKRDWRE